MGALVQLNAEDGIGASDTTAAAPTAGTVIAFCTVLTTGLYVASGYIGAGSTADTTLDNVALRANFVTKLKIHLNPVANLSESFGPVYCRAVAGQAIGLYVIANSSAGAIYKGSVHIKKLAE